MCILLNILYVFSVHRFVDYFLKLYGNKEINDTFIQF